MQYLNDMSFLQGSLPFMSESLGKSIILPRKVVLKYLLLGDSIHL